MTRSLHSGGLGSCGYLHRIQANQHTSKDRDHEDSQHASMDGDREVSQHVSMVRDHEVSQHASMEAWTGTMRPVNMSA